MGRVTLLDEVVPEYSLLGLLLALLLLASNLECSPFITAVVSARVVSAVKGLSRYGICSQFDR